MSFKKYIAIVLGAAVVGWLSFFLVLTKLSPCQEPGTLSICHSVSALSLALFLLSIFFALAATFTLLGFLLRYWFHRSEIYLDHFTLSLRQGILLTLSSCLALGLLLLNALTWWSGFLLLAIIFLLELYFSRE